MNFTETDNKSAVYKVSQLPRFTTPTSIPQKAKSIFHDKHDDVEWDDLRAEMKKVGDEVYAIVGECN